MELEETLRRAEREGDEALLTALRRGVLVHGLPEEAKETDAVGAAEAAAAPGAGLEPAAAPGIAEHVLPGPRAGTSSGAAPHVSIRARTWKVLLGVGRLDAARYSSLVGKGEHARYGLKIRNDTFRTFKNCKAFEAAVPEARIVRVLNAFVHSYENDEFTYVQGMNVICGVLLYVMPELDAFHCFDILITRHLSAYMSKNLDGVAKGCKLLEECLEGLDPQLAEYLRKEMDAQTRVYAFAPIMTLSACCRPLDSIVRLWDVYFAAGVHLNIVFYASQMMLHRFELLDPANDAAKQYISGRDFPDMDYDRLVAVAFPFLLKLDKDFIRRLREHTQQRDEPALTQNTT